MDIIPAPQRIDDDDFAILKGLIYQRFGINLTNEKKPLLVSRLQGLLRRLGHASFKEYTAYVQRDSSGEALSELVNRISTNHTFFNRESAHYTLYCNDIIPQALSRQRSSAIKDLRIWSAGCSSGEEPYLLAMHTLETIQGFSGSWKGGILATDISSKVLDIAIAGEYSEEIVRNLPPALVSKYFSRTAGGKYLIGQEVKRLVTFRRFNLMNQVFPFRNSFDAIFCRNVMIYFDQETRISLVKKFYDFTRTGGYFVVSHSESLHFPDNPYRQIAPSVYRRQA